jgi:hypothetical protein
MVGFSLSVSFWRRISTASDLGQQPFEEQVLAKDPRGGADGLNAAVARDKLQDSPPLGSNEWFLMEQYSGVRLGGGC